MEHITVNYNVIFVSDALAKIPGLHRDFHPDLGSGLMNLPKCYDQS